MTKASLLPITIIAAVVIAITVLYKHAENNPATDSINGEATENETASMTDWKTCLNEELGYSVSYPATWYTYGKHSYSETTLFQESGCEGNRVLISRFTAEEISVEGKPADFLIQYQTTSNIGMARYQGVSSLEAYLERNPDLADDINHYEPIHLDGKRFIWIDKGPRSPLLIGFENNLLITLGGNTNDSTFQAMLSSLRFF